MVMEAPPSPDSVGREFVRQYYTLLNKAPTHLHRFYNNQSSFVHGGLDPPHRETLPMIGQKQIHQKIQQLNFQDCHAKITQVDAQATLGNGVVVQVTGELSNAGQPMRRFTQTFVLAAQSPKKYYVHNDIFRYQDEIISDEECENEARSGDEGELAGELPPLGQPTPTLANYYNPNNAPIPQVPQHHQHVMQPPPQQQPAPMQPPTVNGAVHQDEIMAGGLPPHLTANTSPTSLPPTANPAPIMKNDVQVAPVPLAAVEDIQPALSADEPPSGDAIEKKFMDNTTTTSNAVVKPEVDATTEPLIASNEPKTYATLLKSGSGGYPMPPSASVAVNTTSGGVFASSAPPAKSVSPPPVKMESRDRDFQSNMRNNNQQRLPDNGNRPHPSANRLSGGPPRPRPELRSKPYDDNVGGNFYAPKMFNLSEERRRSQSGNFSDSNQLFLGNLPLSATEDDLRELFEKFGPIADLRIHSKLNKAGGGPPPGARAPPNYGFITFETQEGVQACLAAKPIYLPGSNGGSTLLNVEEKKIKDRSSFGGSMRNNQGDNLSPRPPRDNNGPRRGPMPGSGGQPRGDRDRPMGGGGPGGMGGNRPNNFNQRGGGGGAPNRGPGGGGPNNNTYARR